MRRFDVFEYLDPSGSVAVLVLQGDLYLDLATVVIAPLYPGDSATPISRINPIVRVGGEDLILKTEFLGPMPRQLLSKHLANLQDQSIEIQTALDRLLSGF